MIIISFNQRKVKFRSNYFISFSRIIRSNHSNNNNKKYNIGFPRSREIADDSGNTVDVYISTSEYARFADRRIPTPDSGNKGEITAIVGWFQDNEAYDGTWQLTVRSLDTPFADLKGFDFPQ